MPQPTLGYGNHRLAFDAGTLPSALYFLRLGTPSYHQVQKLILLR